MNILWIIAAIAVLLFVFAMIQRLVKVAVILGAVIVLGSIGWFMLHEAVDPATADKLDTAAEKVGKAAGTAAQKAADAAAPAAKKAADAVRPAAEKAARAAAEKSAEVAGQMADKVADKVADGMTRALFGDDDDSAED